MGANAEGGAGERARVGDGSRLWWQREGRVVRIEAVVWEQWSQSVWCVEAGQEGAEQHRVTAGATSHTDRMQEVGGDTGWDHESQRSEVTEAEKGAGQEQCRKGPGMTRPPPKTTTTTQHQTAGGRRGRGQMKN